MATWQAAFRLVPNDSSKKLEGNVFGDSAAQDDFEVSESWISFNRPADLLTAIKKILPYCKSWSEDLLIHGFADGDRIEVFLNNGVIDDVSVRIDMRNISRKFLIDIVSLAKKFQLHFLNSEGIIFLPSLVNIEYALRISPAFRFVHDPERFLDNVIE
jgi:hypothetical protein